MNLRQRFNGLSGSSCWHREPWSDEPVSYEACEKHHGDAAYNIVQQHLGDPLVRTRIAEQLYGSSDSYETVDQIIKVILEDE